MGISRKVTSFTWNEADIAGTTYDVTLGFQPVFVRVWTNARVGTTDAVGRASLVHLEGFGVSDSDRRSMEYISADAQGTAVLIVRQAADAVLAHATAAGGNGGALDITATASWPVDGIRFVIDTALAAGTGNIRVHVLAIGGSDLTEAKTFQFQEPGAAGAQAVPHGLGGAPVGALFMSVGVGTAPASGSATQGMFMLGASDGSRQWVTYVGGDDAATVMDTRSYAKTGECIALGPEPAVTLNARASVTSFDATNINLSWAERAATRYVFGLAWRGGQFRVDSVLTATNTTPFSGPTCGFVPVAMLFASSARAESAADTPTDHAHLTTGVATSSTERVATAVLDEDGVATSECTTALETDEVYINLSTASAVQGSMDVSDMTVDPVQLVMDDADPSAAFVGVLAWGTTPAGAELVGSASLAVTAAASLTTAITLAGASTLAVTTASVLTTAIRFTGTSDLAITATASLSTAIRFTGASAVTVTAAGVLSTAITLNGTADLTVTAAGVMSSLGAALEGAATLTVAAAGDLSTAIRFAGASTATLTATSTLSTAIALQGVATATLTATGALSTAIRLAGEASLTITAAGAMQAVGADLAGEATLTATATADLSTAIPLAGSATLTLVALSDITTAIRLSGLADLVVIAAGSMAPAVDPTVEVVIRVRADDVIIRARADDVVIQVEADDRVVIAA